MFLCVRTKIYRVYNHAKIDLHERDTARRTGTVGTAGSRGQLSPDQMSHGGEVAAEPEPEPASAPTPTPGTAVLLMSDGQPYPRIGAIFRSGDLYAAAEHEDLAAEAIRTEAIRRAQAENLQREFMSGAPRRAALGVVDAQPRALEDCIGRRRNPSTIYFRSADNMPMTRGEVDTLLGEMLAEIAARPPLPSHDNALFPFWIGLPDGGKCRACGDKKMSEYCKTCFLCSTCSGGAGTWCGADPAAGDPDVVGLYERARVGSLAQPPWPRRLKATSGEFDADKAALCAAVEAARDACGGHGTLVRAYVGQRIFDQGEQTGNYVFPLNAAAFRGNVEAVKMLLEAGANPNRTEVDPSTWSLELQNMRFEQSGSVSSALDFATMGERFGACEAGSSGGERSLACVELIRAAGGVSAEEQWPQKKTSISPFVK